MTISLCRTPVRLAVSGGVEVVAVATVAIAGCRMLSGPLDGGDDAEDDRDRPSWRLLSRQKAVPRPRARRGALRSGRIENSSGIRNGTISATT